MDKNDIIKRIVTREFGRFVRYYQDAPELEEVTRKDADDEKRKKKDRRRAQKGYTRFFINIGKKDHVQPVHIIEMLNRNVASRVDVGRIDLMQNFSFFECPEEYTEEILTGMDGVNYKGRQVSVEVAETRSDGDSVQEERQERERKPRADKKPEKREEKSRREEKPKKGKKSSREEKAYRDEKPRHSAQRAPKVQIAQDEDFWRDFDDGDWRSFFRSDNGKPRRGAGRTENKPSKRKDNVKHKESKKKKGSKRR